jgi:pimeloyl-ACP methyl ester carboxylesterase
MGVDQLCLSVPDGRLVDVTDSIFAVSDAVLDDLRTRLQNIRWPSVVEGQGWSRGTDLDYLRELLRYWLTDFDWRARRRRPSELMTANGYHRFVVSGGDVGASVAEQLARRHADRVIALHLTDVPTTHLFSVGPAELTEPEQAYLAAGQNWQMSEGAYALLQSTKPATAAVGLADSPAGLAAWIVEKLRPGATVTGSWIDASAEMRCSPGSRSIGLRTPLAPRFCPMSSTIPARTAK